jgi:hypothetical protein
MHKKETFGQGALREQISWKTSVYLFNDILSDLKLNIEGWNNVRIWKEAARTQGLGDWILSTSSGKSLLSWAEWLEPVNASKRVFS